MELKSGFLERLIKEVYEVVQGLEPLAEVGKEYSFEHLLAQQDAGMQSPVWFARKEEGKICIERD
jgi:hypothetical protein